MLHIVCVSGLSGNWIEIAYGTSSGTVRVIVQHPETVGHGPQLFQTFMVHRNPVIKVMLSEKNLVSICSEYNHVRSWNVTRFRGMISTQPGSTPLASFNVVSLEAQDAHPSSLAGNGIGEWESHHPNFRLPCFGERRFLKSVFFYEFFSQKLHFFSLFLFLGPFGERDDQQVFIQKLVPDTDHVIVRFSSTGKR